MIYLEMHKNTAYIKIRRYYSADIHEEATRFPENSETENLHGCKKYDNRYLQDVVVFRGDLQRINLRFVEKMDLSLKLIMNEKDWIKVRKISALIKIKPHFTTVQ